MEKFDRSKWLLDESDFKPDPNKKSKKNSGACGIVSFWIQKSTGLKCAKKITQNKITQKDIGIRFEREIKILGSYHHPAIVPFVGFYEKNKKGVIFLKAIDKGSLHENIIKNNKQDYKDPLWDDTHKLIIAYGIAAAMEYLHSFNVIHRDLKPLNVLLDSDLYPFVTDFDASKEVDPKLSIHQSITGTTACIMSPEFYESATENKDKKCIDYYAFGMTLYHLITGFQPFEGLQPMAICRQVINGIRPNIPSFTPDCWKDMIVKCWDQNPSKRPTFTSICNSFESSVFNNSSIDQKLFNDYVDKIKPYRPKQPSSLTKSTKPSKPDEPLSTSIEKLSSSTPHEGIKKLTKPSPPPEAEDTRSQLDKLRDEALKGNYQTQFELGKALFQGTFGPPDYEEAKKHFISVVNKSNDIKLSREAEDYVADCYIKLEEYENARKYLFKHGIYHNNADASFQLAEMIFNGVVRPTKPNEMEGLYRLSAQKGHPGAIVKYSLLCEYGSFGRHNLAEANKYFELGSENGIPQMMHKWSIQLLFGRGVEKDVKQAMSLLLGSANLGCTDAQYDYAMKLLKGTDVEQDVERATELFKTAAENGHSTSMLWYSLLSRNVKVSEEASDVDFFARCLEEGTEYEAFAVEGQRLHRNGQINDAIGYLDTAMHQGSLLALLELGEICEENPSLGEAAAFFEHSATHCHCLDELGFSSPIAYKHFHCKTCDMDVCEGCAKHCHAKHDTVEVQEKSLFVCQCGMKGPLEGRCSEKCFGDVYFYQHLFQCQDCYPNNDQVFICKACADKCHKNHRIIDYGVQRNFCSCGNRNNCTCKGFT